MAQRKEKYSRKLEDRVLNLEAAVYEDLLPYRMAIRQREERRMEQILEDRQREREYMDRVIGRHDREMFREFCICAALLMFVTACITAFVVPAC